MTHYQSDTATSTLLETDNNPATKPSYASRGFTIVELLIVIVVIGILAAIVIVAFNGVQNRAKDTSVSSDLKNISKQIELHKIDNNDVYTSNVAAALAPTGSYSIRINKSAYDTATSAYNLLYCSLSPYSSYAVLATSGSGKKFYVLNGGPVQEYTSSTPIWTNTNTTAICGSVLAGSNNAGSVGFRGNVDPPEWRPWTGVN